MPESDFLTVIFLQVQITENGGDGCRFHALISGVVPDIAGLIAHIRVAAGIGPEKGHDQVQTQRGGKCQNAYLPAVKEQAQQPFRQKDRQYLHNSQEACNQRGAVPGQPVENLVNICSEAVIPAIVNDHADVVGQIRLKISIIVIQRLNGLHIEQICAQYAVNSDDKP